MFPETIEMERLRRQGLAPHTVNPLVLYEHVNESALHIHEIISYLFW